MIRQHDKTDSSTFHNVEKLTNELQNVKLDNSTTNLSVYFESDSSKKMNQQRFGGGPSLSNYFGTHEQNDKLQFVNISGTSPVNANTPQSPPSTIANPTKEEPVVCRIFAETPQPKTVDPTSNFFDTIMQRNPSSLATGVISDIGLSSFCQEDSYNGAVLGGNEVSRRRDAWIPSERTREALIASATSPPGTYVPSSYLLTKPGVILEDDMNDMLQEVVTHYLGEAEASQRKILTANDVTQDDRGLRELIQASCYRAAINLTSRLLKIYGQSVGGLDHITKHTPHSLQLWFTRIALLVKIKSYSLAENEAEAFGDLDNPDLYYQFYPDKFGGQPGSIVPFSFRLLLAELPMHCGKPRESMIRLNKMLTIVRQILTNLNSGLMEDGNPMELNESDRNESIQLWTNREMRINHAIINCALFQENYGLAIQIIKKLILNENIKLNQKIALHSALGRILLQMGDINGAEKCFSMTAELNGGISDTRNMIDKSLVSIARNNFTEAYQILVQANQQDSTNIMILNNMAVCLLYTGRLKEAISLLENAINANPTRGLNDSLLFNLCTLYELESSHSTNKKLNLLRQLARYKADAGMNIQQCLKLPV